MQTQRSQEISSKEMEVLFSELEEFQRIAHFGSWTYDYEADEILLSAEAYALFGITPSYHSITNNY